MPNYTSPSAAYRPAHQGYPGTLPEPKKAPAHGTVLQLHADATALYTYTVYMNDGSEYYQVPAPTAVYAMLAAEGIARYNARDHHAIDAVRNP